MSSRPLSQPRGLEAQDLPRHGLRPSPAFGRLGSARRQRRSRQSAAAPRTPAQGAAARTYTVNAAVGAVALASILFVLTRLAESWQVGDRRGSHSISLLGQTWSYPAANAGAIAVTALAALGLVVLLVAIRASVREMRANAAFRRVLAALAPSSIRGARVIEDDHLRAFCAGLRRPQVYISRGALEVLSDAELRAVLAHERHHARRRDPLRLASARVLADALFFVPPLKELVQRQHSLAEIGADEAAVEAVGGDRSLLAGAMLSFSEAAGPGEGGLAPERIDYLVGERPDWGFPLLSLLVTCLSLAVLVTLAALLAETARGSATLAPPVVSAKPCVVMLALVPAVVAAAGLVSARLCSTATRAALRRDPARS
jgi:Zn-dependent protease with chaperone function